MSFLNMLDNTVVIITKNLGNWKTKLVDVLINDMSILNYQTSVTITPEITIDYIRGLNAIKIANSSIDYYKLDIKLVNDKTFKLQFKTLNNYSINDLIYSKLTADICAFKINELLVEISKLNNTMTKDDLVNTLNLCSNNDFIDLVVKSVETRLINKQFSSSGVKLLVSELLDKI